MTVSASNHGIPPTFHNLFLRPTARIPPFRTSPEPKIPYKQSDKGYGKSQCPEQIEVGRDVQFPHATVREVCVEELSAEHTLGGSQQSAVIRNGYTNSNSGAWEENESHQRDCAHGSAVLLQ
jgi:hypothetical protein